MPHWLAELDVPLFASHRRLAGRRTLPRARTGWALDSGGFTELSMFGGWRTAAEDYVAAVRRYATENGNLEWAAPMDWMCEPVMLAKTGLDVPDHQRRTVDNFLRLRDLAPDLPFIPVIQGVGHRGLPALHRPLRSGRNRPDDLPDCGAGQRVPPTGHHRVVTLVGVLAGQGLRLHGFGVKTAGARLYAPALLSADSMSWSYRGRKIRGCSPTHASEANCARFALTWRSRLLDAAHTEAHQLALDIA
jgi:hypothetical protein